MIQFSRVDRSVTVLAEEWYSCEVCSCTSRCIQSKLGQNRVSDELSPTCVVSSGDRQRYPISLSLLSFPVGDFLRKAPLIMESDYSGIRVVKISPSFSSLGLLQHKYVSIMCLRNRGEGDR